MLLQPNGNEDVSFFKQRLFSSILITNSTAQPYRFENQMIFGKLITAKTEY